MIHIEETVGLFELVWWLLHVLICLIWFKKAVRFNRQLPVLLVALGWYASYAIFFLPLTSFSFIVIETASSFTQWLYSSIARSRRSLSK